MLAGLLERFRRGPELVATIVTGAAGLELDFAPAPGKWTIRQILAHLADAEIAAADRFRRTIAEDNPVLMAYDQEAWTRNLNYQRRKISESLDFFRRLRAQNYELFKDLPQPAFRRTATHSQRGRVTLLDLLQMYAEHAENHALQLRDLRQQYKERKAAPKSA